MKSKLIFFFIAIILGFTTNAQTKVGTIDSEYVLSKMPQLKTVQERLKNYGAKLDSIRVNKIKEHDASVNTYNKNIKTLTEDAKKKEFSKIQELKQDIVKFRQNAVKMMQIRKDEFLRPLYKKIAETTAFVAKEKGYSQILTTTGNEFAYLDEKHDITKLVLAKLGIKE
ncbi:MAG: OmpH family outer membrane protein [Flavobacteriaceae bacterium]|nr:OmpH family outer membrane protein [Flavobacteriaceae bacterium]